MTKDNVSFIRPSNIKVHQEDLQLQQYSCYCTDNDLYPLKKDIFVFITWVYINTSCPSKMLPKKNTFHYLSVIGIPGVFTSIMSCHKFSREKCSKLILSCCRNFFRVTYWNGFRLWKIISKNKHLEISANLFQ